ncbi:MAG TPA: regulatory protein RecX [Solirubrobacterales bacterium]|nr:regulatory protein RecX [Solirubrobacterales bacterium]
MAEPDAFEVALAALRRKERTRAELAAWLDGRGFGDREVREALTRLGEAGELDDERFARRYAEDKRDLSGWGAERIREALIARGIPSSTVEAVLATDTHDDQLERARELLARRGRPLGDNAERQRALDYLARRGYQYEIAYEAVRSVAARAA